MRRIGRRADRLCIDCRKRQRIVQYETKIYEGDGWPAEVELINDQTLRCQDCYEEFALEELKLKEESEQRQKQREEAAARKKREELIELGHAQGGLFRVRDSAVNCEPCSRAIGVGEECTSGRVIHNGEAKRLYWCADCLPLRHHKTPRIFGFQIPMSDLS